MIPAAIRPKLAKLIAVLSSDRDGEVVATVRAIGRTLKGAGADFHDLAKAATAEPVAARRTAPPPPPPPEEEASSMTWADCARWCRARAYRLSPKEAEFVRDMAHKLRFRTDEPTERQGKWLRAIHARLLWGETDAG